MTATEQDKSENVLVKLGSSLWYARGVTCAIALTGMIETVTSVGRNQFLRGIHAVAVGWNKIASEIGSFVGKIPFIPEYSSLSINVLILISMGYLPMIMLSVPYKEVFSPKKIGSPKEQLASSQRKSLHLMGTIVFLYLALSGAPHISAEGEASHGSDLISAYLLVGVLVVYLLMALVQFRKYQIGFIHFVLFLVTLQGLYFLNLPVLGDILNQFSEWALD